MRSACAFEATRVAAGIESSLQHARVLSIRIRSWWTPELPPIPLCSLRYVK